MTGARVESGVLRLLLRCLDPNKHGGAPRCSWVRQLRSSAAAACMPAACLKNTPPPPPPETHTFIQLQCRVVERHASGVSPERSRMAWSDDVVGSACAPALSRPMREGACRVLLAVCTLQCAGQDNRLAGWLANACSPYSCPTASGGRLEEKLVPQAVLPCTLLRKGSGCSAQL